MQSSEEEPPAHFRTTNLREPLTHTLRVETMSTKGVICSFASYLILFVIALIIGASGPGVLKETTSSSTPCKAGKNCTWSEKMKGLSPMSQLFWIQAKMDSPQKSDSDSGDVSTSFPINYILTAKGDGKTISQGNTIHTHQTHCPGKGDHCEPLVLFSVPFIHHADYEFDVIFLDPLGNVPSSITSEKEVRMKLSVHRINDSYTSFEAGWKYFFVTASLIIALAYYCILRRVPSRARSFEQPWMVCLLIMLVGFNDPFFAASIFSPGIGWPTLFVLLSISFITVLLLFILCEFDIVRRASIARVNNSGLVEKGVVFWLPKSILMTAFWVSAVALAMSALLRLDDDPAFDLWDHDGIFRYLFVFTAIISAIYAAWVAIFIVMNLGTIRTMSAASKFIYSLSITTILIALAIFWAGGLIPGVPNGSLQFLAGYTIVNLYVWFMAFATTPSMKAARFDEQLHQERDHMYNAEEEEEVDMEEVQFSDGEQDSQEDQSAGAFAIGADEEEEDKV